MSAPIRWTGTGEPVLFFPGWNTDASTVLSWMPRSFLDRFRCGVVEWPGLGCAAGADLPADLDGFLAPLRGGLPTHPLPVVGFCMGGVAAWAFARRHPACVSLSVLVDSPLHFPAVLSPLLVPGLGRAALALAQGTPLGRLLVRRAILQRGAAYPQPFLESLFAFDRKTAIHYVRLFWKYGRTLRGPYPANRPCWRVVGRTPLRVLAPSLGARHRIEASLFHLECAGHFPAVEVPGSFFDCLTTLLGDGCGFGPEGVNRGERAKAAANRATFASSPSPSGPCAS